jgi:hypothetical protein
LFDKEGITMSDVRTYVCTHDTPIYESPWDHSRVALDGTAHLSAANTFLGQPSENYHIWIATGVGFVPDLTVQPLFEFQAIAATPVYEDHRTDAPIALGGQAHLAVGQTGMGYEPTQGWIWLSSGIGFVPYTSLSVRNAQAYVVQPGDNLTTISQRFYGTPNRWRDIYVANRAVIGPNPDIIHPGLQLFIP